jgi:hypothetical protein
MSICSFRNLGGHPDKPKITFNFKDFSLDIIEEFDWLEYVVNIFSDCKEIKENILDFYNSINKFNKNRENPIYVYLQLFEGNEESYVKIKIESDEEGITKAKNIFYNKFLRKFN